MMKPPAVDKWIEGTSAKKWRASILKICCRTGMVFNPASDSGCKNQ
jgi:hypothetical protein